MQSRVSSDDVKHFVPIINPDLHHTRAFTQNTKQIFILFYLNIFDHWAVCAVCVYSALVNTPTVQKQVFIFQLFMCVCVTAQTPTDLELTMNSTSFILLHLFFPFTLVSVCFMNQITTHSLTQICSWHSKFDSTLFFSLIYM